MNGNSFTYGVEIEGVFKKDLFLQFKQKNIDYKLRTDGSVYSGDIIRENDLDENDIVRDYQEVNIGIFKKPEEFFDMLAMVQSDVNHFWDKRCGLHFHIKAKRSLEMFKASMVDMEFLKAIEKFAYTNLCRHIKNRKANQYCLPYSNLKSSLEDFNGEEKYRFVRLHPQFDTMEFRFFSPCEHKCENIKKFLNYFCKEFKKIKNEKSGKILLKSKLEIITMQDSKKVEKKENVKVLNFNYKINERRPYSLQNEPYDCGGHSGAPCPDIKRCIFHKKFIKINK